MDNFNYFSLLYLNDWKLWDEPFSYGILSENQEDSRQTLCKAAKYYKIMRNFENIQESEGRLAAARSMLLDVQGPITAENICNHVNSLAANFRDTYGRNAVSAASKLLWLIFKSPVIIFDSRAAKWLYDAKYLETKTADYNSYRIAWLNAFQESEHDLENACNKLVHAKSFSLASDMNDNNFKNLVTERWFRERVFDKYIWFNA